MGCLKQVLTCSLQIASCSVHHSGALLLEAQDGEFLDAQLCSSSVAASNHLQQPDTEPLSEAAQQAIDTRQTGSDHAFDGPEGYSNEFDDGGGGNDDGDDYMHEEGFSHEGMPGWALTLGHSGQRKLPGRHQAYAFASCTCMQHSHRIPPYTFKAKEQICMQTFAAVSVMHMHQRR